MPSAAAELADRVTMNAIRLTRTLRALRQSTDLTGPEVSALAVIVHAGRIAARDLASFEEVTPATISRLLATMEAKGLVRRARDRQDGRVQWISATPLGARRVREGHERRLAPLVAAIQNLSRDERETLTAASAVLETAIAAMQSG